jgi:hypothetical protein
MAKGWKVSHSRFRIPNKNNVTSFNSSPIEDGELNYDAQSPVPDEIGDLITNEFRPTQTRFSPDPDETHPETVQGTIAAFMRGKIDIKYEPMLLVIAVAWLLFFSWLFIRDNEFGRLETWDGVLRLICKTLVYTAIYLLGSTVILYWINKRKQ